MEETKKVDDGGPAFPQTHKLMNKGFPDMVVPETTGGLSIRDYFAAKVLQGQIAFEGADGCDPEHIAGCAYQIADAMVKARDLK